MITHPLLIALVLLALELLVLGLARHPRTGRWFSFIPPVFWIYFLPMLAAGNGLIDPASPLYAQVTRWLLPASLVLLLVPVDARAILRLGPKALAMFVAGAVGIIAGGVLSFALFKPLVGAGFWSGFGALCASWTGGSANMIAAREALAVPDHVFAPMVIVDTVIPYLWMGMLMAGVALQPAFDRWNRADRTILDELGSRIAGDRQRQGQEYCLTGAAALVLPAMAVSGLAHLLARQLPQIRDLVSTATWTIVIVTLLGILLSFTPLRRLERYGASRAGSFLLYFVLTTIGARASAASIGSALLLLAAGVVIVAVHGLFLLMAARLLRAPLFLAATASQASIGGVASAPVVAEVYQPGMAPVGLLLAILGNLVGTGLGIISAHLCRLV
ncbi:DUF819 family protein [Trichlorobacter ammonificans]|uniref:DUF819 family protein n=1 Tax=Trichlorobacter ammonificans TaxID=2916410 RepID=A0ABN8HKG0_9BACT|nr:DUF819 family protein [Trichlorobacter ammonificans]CAH2031694.1 conserved membrane protein of unknown function [Trichlorobacter ammonificans]